jgi:hypothetical protein
MNDLLHEYLLQTGTVALPGIGTLRLQRTPASLDVVEQKMNPPVNDVVLDKSVDAPSRKQMDYLVKNWAMDEAGVMDELQTLSSRISRELMEKGTVPWVEGFAFRMDASDQVLLLSDIPLARIWEPTPAHRVLRSQGTHRVLQGDIQTEQFFSSEEQEEVIIPERKPWWLWSLILSLSLLLIILFIYWQMPEHNWGGNQKKVPVKEADKTYTLVP